MGQHHESCQQLQSWLQSCEPAKVPLATECSGGPVSLSEHFVTTNTFPAIMGDRTGEQVRMLAVWLLAWLGVAACCLAWGIGVGGLAPSWIPARDMCDYGDLSDPLTYIALHHPYAITLMAPFFSCALSLTCPINTRQSIYTLHEHKRTYMSTTTFSCQDDITSSDSREPSTMDN